MDFDSLPNSERQRRFSDAIVASAFFELSTYVHDPAKEKIPGEGNCDARRPVLEEYLAKMRDMPSCFIQHNT